jgi:hypothetical protein
MWIKHREIRDNTLDMARSNGGLEASFKLGGPCDNETPTSRRPEICTLQILEGTAHCLHSGHCWRPLLNHATSDLNQQPVFQQPVFHPFCNLGAPRHVSAEPFAPGPLAPVSRFSLAFQSAGDAAALPHFLYRVDDLRPRHQASRRSSANPRPTFCESPTNFLRPIRPPTPKTKDLRGIKREADEMDDEQFRPVQGRAWIMVCGRWTSPMTGSVLPLSFGRRDC